MIPASHLRSKLYMPLCSSLQPQSADRASASLASLVRRRSKASWCFRSMMLRNKYTINGEFGVLGPSPLLYGDMSTTGILERSEVLTQPTYSRDLVTSSGESGGSSNSNGNQNNTEQPTDPERRGKVRADPFAKRPNRICDPYGQGGKPMPLEDARRLLLTIDKDWELEFDVAGENEQQKLASSGKPAMENDANVQLLLPVALVRKFVHPDDFLIGSKFVSLIASVAQMNNHYPSIHLQREISRAKRSQAGWDVVTTVRCHTTVLQGLSQQDFFIAMLIDVEAARPEIKKLLKQEEAKE